MNKFYTAQEMREAANAVDEVSINDNGEYFYEKHEKFNPFLVRDMLRQAADAMEREEREAKDDDKNKPLPCPSCGGEVKIKHMVGGYSAVCECGYCAKFCDSESEAISVHNRVAGSTKRKKRWEYAVMYTALSGCRCISPGRADCIAATKNILSLYNKECEDANIVRREVGEWEVLKE
ncbi:MAG: hypothetical protein MJZ81_10840 [Bacteroidales bacterium]|nr:hypothetical protein [Bacteroidales bacterium]